MNSHPMLPPGLYPVMLTPFRDDGTIDWDALDALIEWYLQAGAAGLFAVCLSSEMYELSEEERFGLAAHVVARARGRVPVVASGTFGGAIDCQAAFVRRMAQTGVNAVVVIPCQLASADEGEAVLRERLEQLMALTAPVPLGLYECPSPYHRVLSPELLSWAARSGRFLYHKDTQADLPPILAKLGAIRNTRLGFFDASTPTALASLLAGAAGVSPIGANYYPALYAWMCRHFADRTAEARELQRMLAVMEGVASRLYPVSAKWYLQQLGLPMGTRCRTSSVGLNYHDRAMLQALRETAQRLCEDLP